MDSQERKGRLVTAFRIIRYAAQVGRMTPRSPRPQRVTESSTHTHTCNGIVYNTPNLPWSYVLLTIMPLFMICPSCAGKRLKIVNYWAGLALSSSFY